MTEKQENTLELANESIKAFGASSSEHAIDKFANELPAHIDEEYEIPGSYGVDTLKCLGVNVNTVYIYWEVTDFMLGQFNAKNQALVVKLISSDDSDAELMNFFITDMVSSRFVSIHLANKNIHASLGIIRDGIFIEMLRSNSFFTPTDTVTLSQDELWMSKTEAFEQIIKASSPSAFNQSSSFGIIKELEFLRKHSETLKASQSVSSFSLSSKE